LDQILFLATGINKIPKSRFEVYPNDFAKVADHTTLSLFVFPLYA